MAIPDYQSLMRPALAAISDKREHPLSEINEKVAGPLGLSAEELSQRLPSGKQRVFYSRVYWALTYMKHAGLLEKTGRGIVRITRRGLEALRENPTRIDDQILSQFPEFRAFQQAKPKERNRPAARESKAETPEELMESGYQALRAALAEELLDRIKKAPPKFFEQLVIDLLLAMGYGGSRQDAAEAVGGGADGGIDGIIKEDKLGLDVVYIQAKRWEGPVGRPVVHGFVGSLEGRRANKGVLITTSTFSPTAIEYVSTVGKKIVLIDGERLSQLLIENGVGVSEVVAYSIKRVDADYFGEE